MASRYEVQVTITSAKDLKNINWRHGSLKPYAIVWFDSDNKCSTLIDQEGDTCPIWNQTLVIPFHSPINDSILHVDIVHADASEDTKPLIGSAKLPLYEVVDEFGLGAESTQMKLDLKRPSGRPHGKLELTVLVRELRSYSPSYAVAAPPSYGVPYATGTPQQAYGGPYVASPPYNNYGSYNGQAPNPYPYSSGAPSGYGYGEYNNNNNNEGGQKSKSGMGMGTGLAVGAVAGVLGGLALAEGFDYVEDKITDDVADKVEDDLGYDDDDGDY
ncbi:C2 domain-containing protein [Heracleum sosnowskyi]|uniref:C2 domain-containing protein n=1 Tax=Heracleum sosnowskyi TaxID=360622 RepID=A0AAD8MWU0_9APIA|nr:C2 domain-containing protein [Heracleum sosnowskyi]